MTNGFKDTIKYTVNIFYKKKNIICRSFEFTVAEQDGFSSALIARQDHLIVDLHFQKVDVG